MAENSFRLKDLPSLFKDSFQKLGNDYGFVFSGALAYFGIFAMPAVLVIVIWVAGLIVGEGEVQQQIMGKIGSILGEQATSQMQSSLSSTGAEGGNIFMTIVGVITLMLSASAAIVYLQKSLNRIWEVKKDPEAGIAGTIWQRLFSIVVILGLGLLMLAFIIVTSFVSGFSDMITSALPSYITWVFYVVNFLISFGFLWLLFALVFKIVPDADIRFKSVWVGSAVTAFLFVAGQYLISFYLTKASPGEAYGAAGPLIVIMIWLFYSALITLLGAEFTQVYARRFGHDIQPSKHAIKVEDCSGDSSGQEQRSAA